jgi:hypothetical protein
MPRGGDGGMGVGYAAASSPRDARTCLATEEESGLVLMGLKDEDAPS